MSTYDWTVIEKGDVMPLTTEEIARHYWFCQCKTCPECGQRGPNATGEPSQRQCIRCGFRWYIRECDARQTKAIVV